MIFKLAFSQCALQNTGADHRAVSGAVSIGRVPVRAVLVSVGLLVIAVHAATGQSNSVPAKYRYTGWIVASEQPGGWPTHLLVEGDAGTLRFADRWNLTNSPVGYRVCVKRVSASAEPCRAAKAPVNTRPSIIPMFVSCCGDFVARWYVSGRLVGSWPFRYVPEHS
jgi:hypothetical protein